MLAFPETNLPTLLPTPEQHYHQLKSHVHLSPTMANVKNALLYLLRTKPNTKFLLCQISRFSKEAGSPLSFFCELSCLRCHGYSRLLSSYLYKIKQNVNMCLQYLYGYSLYGVSHLRLFDTPAFDPLRMPSLCLALLVPGPALRGAKPPPNFGGLPPHPHF